MEGSMSVASLNRALQLPLCAEFSRPVMKVIDYEKRRPSRAVLGRTPTPLTAFAPPTHSSCAACDLRKPPTSNPFCPATAHRNHNHRTDAPSSLPIRRIASTSLSPCGRPARTARLSADLHPSRQRPAGSPRFALTAFQPLELSRIRLSASGRIRLLKRSARLLFQLAVCTSASSACFLLPSSLTRV